MNTKRTSGSSCAETVPTRYELIDKDGRRCGTYPTLRDAQFAVRCLFPDQEQDEDRTGKGWDISVVGAD